MAQSAVICYSSHPIFTFFYAYYFVFLLVTCLFDFFQGRNLIRRLYWVVILWFSYCFFVFCLLALHCCKFIWCVCFVLTVLSARCKHNDPQYHNVIIFVCFKYISTRPILCTFADVVEKTGIKEQDVTSVGKSSAIRVRLRAGYNVEYKLMQNINLNIWHMTPVTMYSLILHAFD